MPHRKSRSKPARPRGALPVLLAGVFTSLLDFFIVNVALPDTQRDLHAGPSAVQFIVAGYGLALAAGLITAGRLGDMYGRRKMYVLGLGLFTLASAACGLAPSAGFLVAARVVQGGAAALLMPQILAIINTSFTGPARARAFTAYGMTVGFGAVFGQLIGGVLIKADLAGLGWRSIFLINIPIGLAAVALAPRVLPESRAPGPAGSISSAPRWSRSDSSRSCCRWWRVSSRAGRPGSSSAWRPRSRCSARSPCTSAGSPPGTAPRSSTWPCSGSGRSAPAWSSAWPTS